MNREDSLHKPTSSEYNERERNELDCTSEMVRILDDFYNSENEEAPTVERDDYERNCNLEERGDTGGAPVRAQQEASSAEPREVAAQPVSTREIFLGERCLGEICPGEPKIMPVSPPPTYKRVFFKECSLAGVSYHLRISDPIWHELEEGISLALVRDRKNKYDRNAVAVALADDFDGDPDDFDFECILGYLPRAENVQIAAMMDAGYADKFEASITSFKSYGPLNSRIRITIYLLSKDPVVVRPDLLRILSLDTPDFNAMTEELGRRGTVHFRWGGFPPDELDLPIVGEDVVMLHSREGEAALYRMKVIAIGDDAIPYLDPSEQLPTCDDRVPFVLSNIAGPIFTSVRNLNFLDTEDLDTYTVYHPLSPEDTSLLRSLLKRHTEWLS